MEADHLRAFLGKDEKLLWWGQPGMGLAFRPSDAYLIPFSLVWCGFAVFWEWSVTRAKGPLGFGLFGLIFVCIGVYLVIGRFFVDAVKRRRTVYGLTNQRVLIYSNFLRLSVRSLELRTLNEMTLQPGSNDSGTITFGSPKTTPWFGGMDATPTFEMIPNAQAIYAMIRQAQQALASL